jgi:hypothetical protein
MMAGYCRSMQEPIQRIKEWYKSVLIVGFFYYVLKVVIKINFIMLCRVPGLRTI